MATIADAENYADNTWIKDPTNQVTNIEQDITFTFTAPVGGGIGLRPVHAPTGKQDIGRATNSGGTTLVANNGAYSHDGIQKRYVHRYFETFDKQFGTIYEGTHTTRTHKYRSVTANKHSYVSSRTVHINSEHALAGANALDRDDTVQYTDVIGSPVSATVDLDWNGTDWVLSANVISLLDTGTNGRYVIQNNAIHTIDPTTLTFSDTDASLPVSTGITQMPDPETDPSTDFPDFGKNYVTDQATNPPIDFATFIDSLESGSVAP